MLKFSANLSLMYTETDFLDRFQRASQSGFKGIEFMFPYAWNREAIAERLHRFNLTLALHNLPAGDWARGERGIACLPDRQGEFQEGVGLAIEYARVLNCSRLNCLCGLTPPGVPRDKIQQVLADNLRFAARALDREHIRLLIEPLNDQDIPGFYLTHARQAFDLIREVQDSNLWLQYDIYHMQIMEGNLINTLRKNMARIGHIQCADNPGRHEPGTGEINFPNLFRSIEDMGYSGWIGCEYQPARNTEDSLKWLAPYLKECHSG